MLHVLLLGQYLNMSGNYFFAVVCHTHHKFSVAALIPLCIPSGHSNGNLEDGEAAVNHGASFITHLFNAMLPVSTGRWVDRDAMWIRLSNSLLFLQYFQASFLYIPKLMNFTSLPYVILFLSYPVFYSFIHITVPVRSIALIVLYCTFSYLTVSFPAVLILIFGYFKAPLTAAVIRCSPVLYCSNIIKASI